MCKFDFQEILAVRDGLHMFTLYLSNEGNIYIGYTICNISNDTMMTRRPCSLCSHVATVNLITDHVSTITARCQQVHMYFVTDKQFLAMLDFQTETKYTFIEQ